MILGVPVSMTPTVPAVSGMVTSSTALNTVTDKDNFYCMLQSFLKHDTVHLRSETFVQWQYQLRLLLDAYSLTRFMEGIVVVLSQTITGEDGSLAVNPLYSSYVK